LVLVLQGLLGAFAALLFWAWTRAFKGADRITTNWASIATGFVTDFFDTLGIGSYAPTTAIIKFFRLTGDQNIPGTMNVGHALPTIAEALIFITLVQVDPTLLVSCIIAAIAGGIIGARIVTRLPVRGIRIGMGGALLAAAGLYAAKNLGLLPSGDAGALGLSGAPFAIAVALHFVFGAFMMIGVGLFAPSLITLSLLGMNPTAAFPIMMGACAFLMPPSSLAFLKAGRVAPKVALGLAIGGVPGVLAAAFIVKSLPLEVLRWGVVGVVIIAAAMMLAGAFRNPDGAKQPAE
jgi:uncharacterized membrane protein YfcA